MYIIISRDKQLSDFPDCALWALNQSSVLSSALTLAKISYTSPWGQPLKSEGLPASRSIVQPPGFQTTQDGMINLSLMAVFSCDDFCHWNFIEPAPLGWWFLDLFQWCDLQKPAFSVEHHEYWFCFPTKQGITSPAEKYACVVESNIKSRFWDYKCMNKISCWIVVLLFTFHCWKAFAIYFSICQAS